MTKEEVIKICKQVRKYFKGGKLAIDDTDAICEALTMAIEALEENESLAKSLNDAAELIRKLQKKNGWIPCSKRLPEDKQVVLITNDKHNVRYGQFRGTGFSNSDCNKWIWKNNTIETVIAWMPLPLPYKEDEP